MFGMTPKDAQGLMEDMSILQNQQRRDEENSRYHETMNNLLEDQEVAAIATKIIKNKNSQILNLQAALSKASEANYAEISEGNEMACVARAAVATVKALVDKIAELTGEPNSEVLNQAKFIFSKRYDAEIDAALGRNSISEDPRLSGKANERSLYIPGAGST